MTARGNKHAFAHMAGRRARGTHAEIQSQCNSLITRAYWPKPTTTTTTTATAKQETRALASPTNPSRPKPPPHSERGGTDFCHAASPSCSDRRSRNLRRGGAFMRIIPRWAPGCCGTSSLMLPSHLAPTMHGGKGREGRHQVWNKTPGLPCCLLTARLQALAPRDIRMMYRMTE